MIFGQTKLLDSDIVDSLVKAEDIERMFMQNPEFLLEEYNSTGETTYTQDS